MKIFWSVFLILWSGMILFFSYQYFKPDDCKLQIIEALNNPKLFLLKSLDKDSKFKYGNDKTIDSIVKMKKLLPELEKFKINCVIQKTDEFIVNNTGDHICYYIVYNSIVDYIHIYHFKEINKKMELIEIIHYPDF